MTDEPAALARQWAEQLPKDFARQLAAALRHGPEAVRAVPMPALPASSAALRDAMRLVKDGYGAYASGALTAFLDVLAEQPTVWPVWTGPESQRSTGRLTLAVLADLINEAREQILLVSYATHPGAEVRAALTRAAERGVSIISLLERAADNPQFNGHGDPLLGIDARRLCWPGPSRPAGAALHAKVLVVDRRIALVGSANLTGHGLERNFEAGLLLRGGPVPGMIAEHILSNPAFVEVPA